MKFLDLIVLTLCAMTVTHIYSRKLIVWFIDVWTCGVRTILSLILVQAGLLSVVLGFTDMLGRTIDMNATWFWLLCGLSCGSWATGWALEYFAKHRWNNAAYNSWYWRRVKWYRQQERRNTQESRL